MFTRLSNQKIQFLTLLLVLGGLLFYITIVTLQTSLICVDDEGCLLEHCTMNAFSQDYKTIIEIATAQNGNCPYKLGTTRNQ